MRSSKRRTAVAVVLLLLSLHHSARAFTTPTSRHIRVLALPKTTCSSSVVVTTSSNDDRNKFLTPLKMTQDDTTNNNNKKNALDKFKSASKLPPQLVAFWESRLSKLLPSVTVGLVSFFAGAVLTIGLILVPIYNDVETLAEPVTLFETILDDLDKSYVEQVDTQKLFETGVNAMLQTLDPYTEFEPKQEAVALTESIGGMYGGVGLVISGAGQSQVDLLNQMEQNEKQIPANTISSSILDQDYEDDDDDLNTNGLTLQEQRRVVQKAKDRGVRVVSAFEGYAFDYGMRVGDKLVAIDGQAITPTTSVDRVRQMLRGEPNTLVEISFERDGVNGVQTLAIPRTIVQIASVKLATLLGNPADGMGYIQLSSFSANSGQEVRQAIVALQRAAQQASTNGKSTLRGLVLDLRGNPGGLLTSAVDVSSLFVPKGSEIVSARGRGFPGVLYKSRVDPLLNPRDTKLAVLVNGGTASAAEIVSGAVQDLDVGVIVGDDRTFGKGLVQNVEDLPFDTALKFTVAKYYTPSGRCIQGVNYKEGGGKETSFSAQKVAEKDKGTFYTKSGRMVRDGGGIEADLKVPSPKASALEVTLLRSGVFADFAAQWSRNHELQHGFEVTDDTYREFQAFVDQQQKDGDLQLESLYNGPLKELKKALKKSGYKGSTKELQALQASIVKEVRNDFERYRKELKEDISQSILARYLPESMLIERGLRTDTQVNEAVKLLSNQGKFDKLLARDSRSSSSPTTATASVASPTSPGSSTASLEKAQQQEDGSRGATGLVKR